jgi:hypothetical protein
MNRLRGPQTRSNNAESATTPTNGSNIAKRKNRMMLTPSNEKEISCGERARMNRVKVFQSSEKLIAELPAVSFIGWLDLGGITARQSPS